MVAEGKSRHRARKHGLETEWIRQWASTYMPADGSIVYSVALFRRLDFNLVHLMHALRRAVVVDADKLDGPGARWVVLSENCDGLPFEISLRVNTDSMQVEIEGLRGLALRDGSNDAA